MKQNTASKNHITLATLIFLLCWVTSLALVFTSFFNLVNGSNLIEIILGLSIINLAGLESLEKYWDNFNHRTNNEKWYRTRLKMIATIVLLAIVSIYMYRANYDHLVLMILLLFALLYLGIYLFKEVNYQNKNR
ncbi:MAG: hypothetical protein LKF37_04740 [Lentilactobacillus diolivorans]|nr:hypothetical protein [Lentilactobacillus diolivorans]RRG01974.1 MAG: hypothetical protein DUD34_10160 [Lactobacillus sp.]